MKYLLVIWIAMFMGLSLQANATETVSESIQDIGNDASREATKKMNRLKEATCMKSEAECLKEKAKNRMQEATDATTDKYNEMKNVIDDD